MALLNFANTYAEISGNLDLEPSNNGDYVKLFFSKDKHIITHGKDFLSTFTNSERGLVPGSGGGVKKILRGNATWAEITTSDLPLGPVTNNNGNTIPTTEQVKKYVDSSFAANDAMRYKGTITKLESGGYTHNINGTEKEGFPAQCTVGDTYRVNAEGEYAERKCSAGDLLICIKDGTGAETINALEYWTAVETNINGEVLNSVNGTSIYTYSSSTNRFEIFAPTTGGTAGLLILMSNGNAAPLWISKNDLTVGTAKKVENALSAGAGLSLGGSNYKFDGSVARTIKLLPASGTTIGGVIIDSEHASDKKTITVDSNGNIYLTHDNIINALGYTPGANANMTTYNTILSNSATATTAIDSLITNPFINLVLAIGTDKTVTGSILIIGQGNIQVTGLTAVSISLGEADDTNYGGIKTGYTSTGKKYAVKLDSGKAYVEVPWISYGLASKNVDGLVPKFDGLGNGTLAADSWVLAKLANETYDWFKLPTSVFGDNWRPILVGGTSIGNKKLNFVPTGDIYLKTDSNEDDIEDISFGLSWYNISTPGYERA